MFKSLIKSALASAAMLGPLQALEVNERVKVASDAKLLLTVEVARHGERAPNYIYDFAADPSENFSVPMNLT